MMHPRMTTSIVGLLWLVVLLAPVGAAGETAGAKLPDPLAAGPFPVGVTTTVFVDAGRTDNFTRQPRTLITEIWYPAMDAAKQMPKNKYSDFIPGGVTPEIEELIVKTYKMSAAEVDKLYWNEAHRNAPVREGRFPLVVFSHGNGGSRQQNTFWCDCLASHGYIIVSADHTGNARWTIIDGKVIPFQSAERAKSAIDRPLDVVFLLDQMIRWDQGGDPRFAGHIDTDHAAIAGMSYGSFTAHWAADRVLHRRLQNQQELRRRDRQRQTPRHGRALRVHLDGADLSDHKLLQRGLPRLLPERPEGILDFPVREPLARHHALGHKERPGETVMRHAYGLIEIRTLQEVLYEEEDV